MPPLGDAVMALPLQRLGRRWRALRRHWHARVLLWLRSPVPGASSSVVAATPLLSAAYGWIVARKRRRELSARPPARVAPRGVPVVSVGNVTFGATGKTPMVMLVVARALRLAASGAAGADGAAGRVPLVLARGYGDDEWRMLARRFPHCALALGADRVRTGRSRVAALERARSAPARALLSVVVLDDGLQQWRLARDLEVVMVDALHPFGNGRLLPCGSLREDPRAALARADVVVAHHAELLATGVERRALLQALQAATDPGRSPVIATSRMKVVALRPALEALASPAAEVDVEEEAEEEAEAGTEVSLERDLRGLEDCVALVLCGVGNPESVRRVVAGLGAWRAVEMEAFPDHHAFSRADVDDLLRRCRRLRAARSDCRVVVVTTEKDLFRSPGPMRWLAARQDTRVLRCELELQHNAAAVLDRLDRLLRETCD